MNFLATNSLMVVTGPNVVVGYLTLLLRILKVFASKLGPETSYTD
jgi:hypothetical protein